ncbi:MAG: oligopeptide transporter, OPT family [Elusimicrobiales bacterium]|nr:oligopeptide transporter, OPT family [Elusimicrobiales bacterium]
MSQDPGSPRHKDEMHPYIPSDKPLAEFTVQTVVLGLILSIVFNAANAYMGLKIGMTVSASIPSAIISMATLRMILPKLLGRTGTILENNIVHAFASTGEGLASAVIFTVPALLFLGGTISNHDVFMLGAVGGLLGLLLMIPLRHSLVVKEHKNLPFPEGSACAKVLIAGDTGGASAKPVFVGIFAGGIFKFIMSAMGVFKDTVMWSFPKLHQAGFGYEVSPLFVGVGYLVGLRIAAVMFAGGMFGYWVVIPLIHAFGGHNIIAPGAVPIDMMCTDDLRSNYLRYIGAGGVAFGGLISVFFSLPDIAASLRHSMKAFGESRAHLKTKAESGEATTRDPEHKHIVFGGALLGFLVGGFAYESGVTASWLAHLSRFLVAGAAGALAGGAAFHFAAIKAAAMRGSDKRVEQDMPLSLVAGGVGLVFLVLWLYPAFHLGFLEALTVLVISAFFVAVSARMVGLIGTTNQPISGMTTTGLLTLTLLFLALGHSPETIKIAAVTGGAIVCIAIALSGDLSQDLKCAALIGATPWKVQLAQIMGAMASAVRSGFILLILYAAYGFGAASATHPHALEAPQAQLMAKLIEGATGGSLPWLLLALGAGIGLTCELCGISALAFSIGLYLPITNWPMILLGGVIAWAVARRHTGDAPLGEHDSGALYCSGLIAGDALMGIAVAGLVVMGDKFGGAHLWRALSAAYMSVAGNLIADFQALQSAHPVFSDALPTALYMGVAASVYYFAAKKRASH